MSHHGGQFTANYSKACGTRSKTKVSTVQYGTARPSTVKNCTVCCLYCRVDNIKYFECQILSKFDHILHSKTVPVQVHKKTFFSAMFHGPVATRPHARPRLSTQYVVTGKLPITPPPPRTPVTYALPLHKAPNSSATYPPPITSPPRPTYAEAAPAALAPAPAAPAPPDAAPAAPTAHPRRARAAAASQLRPLAAPRGPENEGVMRRCVWR